MPQNGRSRQDPKPKGSGLVVGVGVVAALLLIQLIRLGLEKPEEFQLRLAKGLDQERFV